MASTSASSIQKSFKYDVFLSFRGEDTRKNFVDHLYHALKQRGINTYRDNEEINKGERISDELITSIQDSKFYIIIFSKNYASSSWCLDELVKVIECQNMIEHTAYPVFYDVEPTEVRNQSGAVEEAFLKHREKEAAGQWRDALRQAADLAGWELKTTLDGHEASIIKEIVKKISLRLHSFDLSVDGKLIGMGTRVRDVVSSLETEVNDVRMIGIKGIGGGGKTTLARVVFNQISIKFEGSSFVENVREVAKSTLGGLESLRKQIASDVLHDPNIIIKDDSQFKRLLCGRKVLVVLDDVDDISQLEALAGELNWFKPGSRVIITTREEQVLVTHRVPKELILNVNLLSHEEAICLFSRHAFRAQVPVQGYENLSEQVVRYAAGLPLTIRVLGSSLCGKGELQWADAIKRLKTIPLSDTMKKLELSYKSLDDDEKEIFLDVTCLLKGWKEREAIIALESCGFHAINGLKVLELKSLITISESGCLDMHDHIEEMGQNIVRRLHPNEPYKHSRLWIKEEVNNILVEDKCTEEARCIRVRVLDRDIVMKGLRKMKELRFLDVTVSEEMVRGLRMPSRKMKGLRFLFYHINFYNNYIGQDSLYLTNSLQYIRWHGYPFKSLPKNFQANNLVGLQMHTAEIHQLWQGKERKGLKKLRFIHLHHCFMLRSLDIGPIPNLERLSLVKCYQLEDLHIPFKTSKLRFIEICNCGEFRSLDIGLTPNLKELILVDCYKLRTLDLESAQNLETLEVRDSENLEEIHLPVESLNFKHFICTFKVERLNFSRLKTLNLTLYPNIETLDLECKDLLELHMPIESPKLKTVSITCSKLRTLNLVGAHNLEVLNPITCNYLLELQMPIESPELKIINIGYSKLRTLNLKGSRNLERLYLRGCRDLVDLHLPIESPKLETINILLSKLRTLNLTGARNLKRLDLEQCEQLVELHMPIESHELKTIHIDFSMLRTLNLTGSRNLELLYIKKCWELIELHTPIESHEIKIIDIRFSRLRTLNLTGSRNLERLHLGECRDLVEFHMPNESHELKTISIHCSMLRTLNLTGSRNLERLDLRECGDLAELHMPIESHELKTISIRCSMLRTLNLKGSRNLERLHLGECGDLVEFHMPIESHELKTISIHCSMLRTLNLTGSRNLEGLDLGQCWDLVELHMPIESPKLKTINIHCSTRRYQDLERLEFEQCEDLEEPYMPIESSKLKTIRIRSSKLRTLHLGLSPYLDCFDLNECFTLKEVDAPIGCLSGHVSFIPIVVYQGIPMAGSLAELHLIVRSLGICSLHPDNNLPKFHFKCICKDILPSWKVNLKKLITSFGICACTNLASLSGIACGLQLRKLTLEGGIPEVPKELDQLECLEELTLLSTNIEHLPNSICMLKNLKVLQIKSCGSLKQLPEDLGRLECLEELCLTDCASLRDIPDSLCEMKRLTCFHLINCILVKKLPKEMGRLQCLKELNIQGTDLSDIPENIFEMEDLRFFSSWS